MRISPSRRLVIDLLHFSRRIPTHSIVRECSLARLASLRKAAGSGPAVGWAGLFLKAYGLLSARRAELRRCYMPWPSAHLYEHPHPVGRITVSRRCDGEDRVFFARIERPDLATLEDLQVRIERLKRDPVETIDHFRHQIVFARFPSVLRRLAWWVTLNVSGHRRVERLGTFGMTSVAAAGALSLHPPSVAAVTLTYGPVDAKGNVRVIMAYDHRQLDGMAVAMSLRELEEILEGEVADELEALRLGAADLWPRQPR